MKTKTIMILFSVLISSGFFMHFYSLNPFQGTRLHQQNIVPNSSFENADGYNPAQWKRYTYRGKPEFIYAETGHTGFRSVMISSEEGADASWGIVIPVKPYSRYRISAWIKTENLTTSGGRGALINVHGIRDAHTEALTGTTDWKKVDFLFDSEANDAVQLNCLFGGYGMAEGTAWFDDISMELISTRELHPSITIDGLRTGQPISKYIYGQFIEHLGRCIYGGIWAEMLKDRKFFYEPEAPGSPWKIIGESRVLNMVRENSYTGEHTPEIILPGNVRCGLVQDSLALIEGKEYQGRIVISGSPRSLPVEVSLIWGRGESDRETVTVNHISSKFIKVPVNFTAGKTTASGKFEIVSRGKGSFQIGTASLMPADNVHGFRRDVLKLLKELDAPVYRWPGGNFVSGYDWKDGIGDRDRRPPRKNPAWKGIEHNDVGIHEFIAFCREIDTEPYVTVNTGLGSVEAAAEEVEYCNGPPDTPMGKHRAANGHPEPFGVKWWAVGNEMYGRWQLGNMPLEEYIEKHKAVVDAMREKDSSIQVVGVGAVGRWSEQMMTHCSDHMDLISEHFYCGERPGILSHVSQIPANVKRIAEVHRKYRETIPSLAGKDIRVALDEWNYWYGPYIYGELGTQYFLKDGLGIAAGLHEYFKHGDVIFMANYAQTVNVIGCIKTNKTEAQFESTGLVLKLYRNHYGETPIEVMGMPEPLNVAAAWGKDWKTITLGVINPTIDKYNLSVNFRNISLSGNGILRIITGNDPMVHNEPGKEPVITIKENTVRNISNVLEIQPLSVMLFSLEVK